jgi:hypothetical protein
MDLESKEMSRYDLSAAFDTRKSVLDLLREITSRRRVVALWH